MTLNEFLAKAGQLLGLVEKNITNEAAVTQARAEVAAKETALTGDKAKLVAGATLPADLVTAANSIFTLTAELEAVNQKASTLEGDKTKLVAGATLPTDLVTAANSIATLTKERDDAKATIAAPAGAIQTAAAAKAAEITAAQGQAPIATAPVATPAAKATETTGLKGLAAVRAAIKAQIAPQLKKA